MVGNISVACHVQTNFKRVVALAFAGACRLPLSSLFDTIIAHFRNPMPTEYDCKEGCD